MMLFESPSDLNFQKIKFSDWVRLNEFDLLKLIFGLINQVLTKNSYFSKIYSL